MNLGLFNARGINETEHFIPLEIEELRKRGHSVTHYWIKGKHPTHEEVKNMDFAIFHFVPTAMFFRRLGIPFCVLPTANDVFMDEGKNLKIIESNRNCKFIGYQSFYHKRKYNEWGITKPVVHVPHCVRTSLFKRQTPYNPSGKIVAGGRLIPKKGLDRLKGVENLTIFGDGPLRDKLAMGFGDKGFTGYLSGNQLKDLFEESSIYLFPAIITPDGDSDGIPNTIKEALLMELYCIASPVAGIPEIESVTLLEDWSTDKIKKVIEIMPTEPNKKGRSEILKSFSPQICVNKLLKGIYEYREK